MNLLGLDFEASGSDPWGKHVPIQIGIATPDGPTINRFIGGWDWSEWEWSEEAAQVHGITKDFLAKQMPVWKVDIHVASDLLRMDMVGARMWNVTVGWNVAGYDRQFITRWFPNVNRLLSYRTIDLNALVFAEATRRAGIDGTQKALEKHYKTIKGAARASADDLLGITEADRHDAAVDAMAALLEYEALIEQRATDAAPSVAATVPPADNVSAR